MESLTKEITEDIFREYLEGHSNLIYEDFELNDSLKNCRVYYPGGAYLDIPIVLDKPERLPHWFYCELQKIKLDVNNLIPQGLAIDVTTLEVNPYK